MFNRTIIHELEQWKERKDRKPLMMLGARQVGKTSVLKKFGEDSFEHCAYFSLDEEEGVCDIFRKTKNPLQIIEQLSYLTSEPILPQKTLLILDEIQDCPEAISAMKYFCEKTPEYAVACAGSLLRLAFGHQRFSFPVGKVDHMNMYPVTFSEFLEQRDASLYQYYMSIDSLELLPDVFFDRLSQAFTAYRISGGMPAVAMKMIEKDLNGVETMLRELGRRLKLNKVHPHKFRRTLATTAIDKGMPIEQVQQLLGHQKIDTTMHYAMVKQQNVKLAHRKFIG